jgi:hypothetical protein
MNIKAATAAPLLAMSMLLLPLLLMLTQVRSFNIVVDDRGGGLEVQLIVGKLATRAGNACHIMTATDEKSLRGNRALMYQEAATVATTQYHSSFV